MTYYVIKSLLATVAFPVMLVVLYFRYHTMRYRFDAEGIHMSWGLLFRHEVMLNYSRIQDIHLRSSVVERYLGLARIEVQTAAGGSQAEMVLEGLTDHDAMRDFLYSRMRGVREAQEQGALTPGQDGANPLAGTLNEIAAELRAIRTLMTERQPGA